MHKDVLCAFQIMRDIIRKCLEITESLSLRSIAFPAIGTGNLGFPKTIFAELITSEVLTFSSKTQLAALQEVQFLLHPNDHENIQVQSHSFLVIWAAEPYCSQMSSWWVY